jgi:hypothetical protein
MHMKAREKAKSRIIMHKSTFLLRSPVTNEQKRQFKSVKKQQIILYFMNHIDNNADFIYDKHRF